MSNQSNCQKHKAGASHLEPIMEDLPHNQGGAGRHKCPYCAYEAGKKKGYKSGYKKGIVDGNQNDEAKLSLTNEVESLLILFRIFVSKKLKDKDKFYEILDGADKILTEAFGKSLSKWRKGQKAIDKGEE